jgi:Na+-driven multidrug efflux pump
MLEVGLPAGSDLIFTFVFMAVVYWVIKDFGAQAQAGFGIGSRIIQAFFLPTMAIAFAVAPVAGQSLGAGNGHRVRETAKKGIVLCSLIMFAITLLLQWRSELFVRLFTDDAEVIRAGELFLRIVSLNFIAQGVILTCSGMFQGMGNTWPALLSSGARLALFVPCVLYLKSAEGFTLSQVWYVAVVTVTLQAVISYAMLRGEFDKRLSKLSYVKVS